MMVACDCGALPVVHSTDRMKPLGVITDRDIACRGVAEGKNPQEDKVADCMTVVLASVSPDASTEECCTIMEEYQVRRLLVTDKQGRLCGIISQADLARHLPNNQAGAVLEKVSEPLGQASALS